MARPKFRVGESVEAEYTFYYLDENDEQVAVDLARVDITEIGARLHRDFRSGRELVKTFSNLTAADKLPLKVSDTPTDGSVLVIVDPELTEELEEGEYSLEFFLKFSKPGNVLYPDGYDLKYLLNEIKFELV